MAKLIAVIDDEPDILSLVALHLKKSGFEVKEFSYAKDFLNSLTEQIPDLVILDLMLPDIDGIEVCRILKMDNAYSSIPVIMLTARAAETDKVLGLELGADDYVTKPFSPRELVARVKAVLRRSENKSFSSVIKIGELSIDEKKFEVRVKDRKVNLTTTEFRILQFLAQKKGWVLTREQILNFLWGYEKTVVDRTIDVHIKNIREKLGEAKKYIINVRGVGYKLEE